MRFGKNRMALTAVAMLLLAFFVAGCEDDTVLRDSRDGKVYRIVELGNQIWMAENLAYEAAGSYCHGDDPTSCAQYGRLYTWGVAMGACPEGWHLPSREELDELLAATGGISVAGKLLKSAGGWKGRDGNGTDGYGFAVPPAGYRGDHGHYYLLGERANLWSSTRGENDDAYNVSLHALRNSVSRSVNSVSYGYSVRCVKNRD